MKDQTIKLPPLPDPIAYAIAASNTGLWVKAILAVDAEYAGVDLMDKKYVGRLITTEQAEAYARAAVEPYVKRIAELEAANSELERLCEKTYVAQGADAYNHACEIMEHWQAEREKQGKVVGTTGSLCDGIAWLYNHIDELEADRQARGEPVLYQSRTRPTWPGARKRWSVWRSCTKDQADDYRRVKVLHDWEYEVRELYPAPQPQQIPEKIKQVIQKAYGHLWMANSEPGTPRQYPPELAAHKARKLLLGLLTKEERGDGINSAMFEAAQEPKGNT